VLNGGYVHDKPRSGQPDVLTDEYTCSTPSAYVRITIDAATTLQVLDLPEVDFDMPGDLVSIEEGAFRAADMTCAVCPEGLAEIGPMAFADCVRLRVIYMPTSVTSIAGDAFSGCGDVAIYAPAGSAAQAFALENGMKYVPHMM